MELVLSRAEEIGYSLPVSAPAEGEETSLKVIRLLTETKDEVDRSLSLFAEMNSLSLKLRYGDVSSGETLLYQNSLLKLAIEHLEKVSNSTDLLVTQLQKSKTREGIALNARYHPSFFSLLSALDSSLFSFSEWKQSVELFVSSSSSSSSFSSSSSSSFSSSDPSSEPSPFPFIQPSNPPLFASVEEACNIMEKNTASLEQHYRALQEANQSLADLFSLSVSSSSSSPSFSSSQGENY